MERESNERLNEAEKEPEEAGATSWLEAEYEAPRSVRYYVPGEVPPWNES